MSDYEKLRLANIARNNGVMKSLGLENATLSGGSRSRKRNQSSVGGRRETAAKHASVAAEPTRRSGRTVGLPAPNYKDVVGNPMANKSNLAWSNDQPSRRSGRTSGLRAPNYDDAVGADLEAWTAGSGDDDGDGLDDDVDDDVDEGSSSSSGTMMMVKKKKKAAPPPPPPSEDSSRAMLCDVKKALGQAQLGKAMPHG